jgi:hypothetical protein
MTMKTGYPGKKSAEVVRKEQAPETQKCQKWKRISRKKQITTQVIAITNKFEALQHAETEGNTKYERKDSAPPQIFVGGITNMQRLTATIEQVDNRFNYTLKIIKKDTIEIITNKLEYHKTIIDILKEKTVEFDPYQHRQ